MVFKMCVKNMQFNNIKYIALTLADVNGIEPKFRYTSTEFEVL